MGKESKKERDIIPSAYRSNVICVVVLGVIFWCIYLLLVSVMGFDAVGMERTALFLLMTLALLTKGKNYILTKETIICRFFCIPYQTIPWEDVIQVGVATTKAKFTRNRYHNCIIFTLKGCPKFQPGKELGGDYLFENQKRTFQVAIDEKGQLEKDVKKIQKYYGILDYGYDKLYRWI